MYVLVWATQKESELAELTWGLTNTARVKCADGAASSTRRAHFLLVLRTTKRTKQTLRGVEEIMQGEQDTEEQDTVMVDMVGVHCDGRHGGRAECASSVGQDV
jgi:anthranilate phosphoribosyltransferase